MAVRLNMLAIAAWRLILLLPSVLSQQTNVDGMNPLVPDNFTSTVMVSLTYRTADDLVGPVCGQHIAVHGATVSITLPGPPTEVEAAAVRTPPQVVISGLNSASFYTYVVVDQSSAMEVYGSKSKPFIQEMRANVRGGDLSGGITVVPHTPVVPHVDGRSLVHILIYRQDSQMSNVSILDYVNSACGLGLRCAFDVLSYASNNSFNLEFAGGFVVKEDVFAIAAMSHLDGKKACHKLWTRKVSANPLVENVDNLMVGIKLRFQTKEEVVGEVCGRAFHYMADDVMVEWNTSRPIPSRKMNALPWVSFRHYGNPKKTDETEEKRDYWFTLLMVDQSERDGQDPAKPFVHWAVTNIKNLDMHSGDCNVPFIPSAPREGANDCTFLLYKQTKHITADMANPGDYAEDTECVLQYRCSFNVPRFVSHNGLQLVGVLPYKVQADPVSVAKWIQLGWVERERACGLMVSFKHEGRILGECLPKFDAWKALKMELEECVMEFKKKMIIERMKNMCPELGSHFSEDKQSWNEDNMGDANERAMKQWISEKGKDNTEMMDKMKEEIEMVMKMFVSKTMDETKERNDEKQDRNETGKDLMKPGDCFQVVMKYVTHMKMKMIEEWQKSKDGKDGEHSKDDEPDLKEDGKCLEAAKVFMKEQWEKFLKMKKAMEKQKIFQDEWEKWRQWGKGGDEKSGTDGQGDNDKVEEDGTVMEEMMEFVRKQMYRESKCPKSGKCELLKNFIERMMEGMKDRK